MFENIIDATLVRQAKTLVDNAQRIFLCGHISPDGDAVGSTLAFYDYLTSLGKDVMVAYPNSYPDFLVNLPHATDALFYDKDQEQIEQFVASADLICLLDFNAVNRLETMADCICKSGAKRLMIDHHLNPSAVCDVVLSYPLMSSTCELLFYILYSWGAFETMSLACATDIYCGIMTDTGCFSYNCNRPEVFYVIGQLMTRGIDRDEIYNEVFRNYSLWRYRLLGYVLYAKMEVLKNSNAAYYTLDRVEQKKFHYIKGDTEGLVNMPLSIKGIRLSASFREDTEKDAIRVSLRSIGDFPCNKMAEEFFNGGGHKNASGGELHCSIEEAVEIYKKAVEKYHQLLVTKK